MRSTAIVAFMLLGSGLAAQSYRALLDTSTIWQENFHLSYPPPGGGTFECYRYYLHGDTLVSDTSYKILLKDGHTLGMGLPQWFSGTLAAFLREDTLARKVYVREPTASQEYLMYDFSAGLGPYPLTYPLPMPSMEVTAVDSVVLPDGLHRRMTLNYGVVIIEGIGATTGFVGTQSSAMLVGGTCGLVCQMVNGSVNFEYSSADFDCACGSNVGVPTHAASALRIGPSPTTDFCNVTGAPPNAPFHVRSMDGRIVHSGTCSSSGSSTIDMTALPAAIYLLEILEGNGPGIARIIKQ